MIKGEDEELFLRRFWMVYSVLGQSWKPDWVINGLSYSHSTLKWESESVARKTNNNYQNHWIPFHIKAKQALIVECRSIWIKYWMCPSKEKILPNGTSKLWFFCWQSYRNFFWCWNSVKISTRTHKVKILEVERCWYCI